METEITNVIQAFPNNKQYAIPSYQRNYVWTRAGQWEPLWEDVKALATRWVEEGQGVKPHFLGTIITKEIGVSGFIYRWWVVDGQQRLTTLQILLAATRQAFTELNLNQFADVLSDCLVNGAAVVRSPEDKYKIDPKSGDYENFAAIIDAALSANHAPVDGSGLAACYSYFHGNVCEWLGAKPEEHIEEYANALLMAIRDKLRVVDIRLGESDNPHTIFEALNARGEPLTEWEKTKNYILSIAAGPDDPDGDATYGEHLERYDAQPYWNEIVTAPRFKGKRIDLFLFYFAQIELPGRRRDVSGDSRAKLRPMRRSNLYREFRYVGEHYYRHSKEQLQEMLERLKSYADIYTSIDKQDGYSPYALEVMRRRHVLKLNSLMPVFMELVAKLGTEGELDRVLRIVDSYLMRRVALKARYSGFDDTAFGHVQALRDATREELGAVLMSRFVGSSRPERWPTDEEVVRHFMGGDMYHGISSARLQLLLRGVAKQMHEEDGHSKTMEFVPKDPLSVEHVAPQGWERHWRGDLSVGASEEDRWRTRQIVNRIGNLTLVTQPMNSKLGDNSWSYKADLLREDNLEMNLRLLRDMEGDVWNESEIDRRSRQLAGYVTEIWPDAEVLADELDLDVIVADIESDSTADDIVTDSEGLTPRQENARRYGDFWSHYVRRHPEGGLREKFRGANQWIRRGNGNPDLSLMFARDQVGIFFTRWNRVEEGEEAWVAGRRAIIDNLVGVGRHPSEFQPFDTYNADNWDAMCDWLHERLGRYLSILEAEPEEG